MRGVLKSSSTSSQFLLPEERREYDRLYRLRNKDKKQKYHRQYYLQNEAKISESTRRLRSQNKDSRKEYARCYRGKAEKDSSAGAMSDYYRRFGVYQKDRIRESNREYRLQNHKDPDRYSPRTATSKTWKTPALVRDYFESIAKQLNISNYADWYRISSDQIKALDGGTLFPKFGNLGNALQYAYPEADWDTSKFSHRGKKSGQRRLAMRLAEILPGCEILEDYQHPELAWADSGRAMELDLWIPQHRLGLEYQGEHHYFNLNSAFGSQGTGTYLERDLAKASYCERQGITLVNIPYWWDGERGSLAATLHQARPSVFPVSLFDPIPVEMPLSCSIRLASIRVELE